MQCTTPETGQSVARLEALAQLMDGASILPGTMALLRRYIEKHGITCPGGKVIDGDAVHVG
jgi:hypothetical protein